MRLVKLYCLLFLLSVLLLQPVWSSEKYILPMIPFFLIFVSIALWRIVHSGKQRWVNTMTMCAVAILLLSNAIYIGRQAFRQITNNIDYLKGDRYAGYPPETRQMFLEMERARELPDDVQIVCRKPEFLYLVSGGKKSVYPWQVKEVQ